MRDRSLTVGEIADGLGVHQPQVSKHLRILSDSGLVGGHPSVNRRIYKLLLQPFLNPDDWIGSFQTIWEDRFERLADDLSELQAK